MAKIFQIKNNTITFVGTKGEEISGTSEDCRLVGGVFTGTSCIIENKEINVDSINNRYTIGQQNEFDYNALNTNVQGNYNQIDNVDSTHTIGNLAHTTRHKEFNHAITSSLGRTQRSVLMFEGRTTDDTETEIFIGGESNKRFIIDETKESVIALECYILARRVDSSDDACMGKYQRNTFRVHSGVLSRIGQNNLTNHNHGINAWTNDFTAVSDTPDYIKVTCTGELRVTIDWSVIVMVNELKTSFI
ncbi:MAG: hypothetical protein Unbinned1953contig1002_9 [Prokaryotic dsDNA virus sp.]|nr:MAG: hypothetical protein Unbinned1953contig1002_9 [Prokaryotic dsDNA virus sp.]|tara:strand:+ start:670 stop:1410 length:741 start_codon:yes stop_codon:yes gene_type:complete